jgi:hypothetical protein
MSWYSARLGPPVPGVRLVAPQYAPKSVGVLVTAVLAVAGSLGRRLIGFA